MLCLALASRKLWWDVCETSKYTFSFWEQCPAVARGPPVAERSLGVLAAIGTRAYSPESKVVFHPLPPLFIQASFPSSI